MIVWMVYSAITALIVAGAARAAESLARLAGYRVRWIWAAALAFTALLSASAPFRVGRAAPPLAVGSSNAAIDGAFRDDADAHWLTKLSARADAARRSIAAPLRRAMVAIDEFASPVANAYAAVFAAAISIGLAILFVAVGRRFRQARYAWPVVKLEGVDVRVAPRVGPLVIGVVHPEIVVPRWLLARNAGDRRLVVAHEHEHVRARDPLLLGVALVAGIAAPWNLAVWYMLSRLRLTIELDCDARVLRHGAPPRSYGSLLIDVAQEASGLRLSALALADDSSHLHQRILAMKPRVPRFARLRGGLAAAFSLVAIGVACQASLPAAADVAGVDMVPAAHVAGNKPSVTRVDTSTPAPDTGAQRNGVIAPTRGAAPVRVGLRKRPIAARADSSPLQRIALPEPLNAADSANALGMVPPKAPPPKIILIDGVRSTMEQLRSIARDQIDNIEIVKGSAAAEEYNDPEAANGVIAVTTKRRIGPN